MLVGAIGSSLLFLVVLACPVGMGLMMWFMGRGMMGGMKKKAPDDPSSLAEMKAEQARLAEKIEALGERQSQAQSPEREPDRASSAGSSRCA